MSKSFDLEPKFDVEDNRTLVYFSADIEFYRFCSFVRLTTLRYNSFFNFLFFFCNCFSQTFKAINYKFLWQKIYCYYFCSTKLCFLNKYTAITLGLFASKVTGRTSKQCSNGVDQLCGEAWDVNQVVRIEEETQAQSHVVVVIQNAK